ncbi:putative arabinase [Testicularia cyperi]|uniref:Putative arabinase n=1 Tax=Testicularia cyperi TaxID=1882483 RepID=A0A317XX89_9BASI|nr:putative arabinase [Testicularia cyperi]
MLINIKSSLVATSLALLAFTSSALGSPVPAESQDLAERATPKYAGYGFYYFLGNAEGQEQIYAAVSKGNDPTSWDLLNKGNPILVSNVGTKGVRDPYLIRSPDGTKYFLIATDLHVGSGTSFEDGARRGSNSIVIWQSSDLKNWSSPILSKVIDNYSGEAWAPEGFYNSKTGKYDIFFAGNVFNNTADPHHDAAFYHRIFKSSTYDFKTFDAAQVYIDRKGDGVIDMDFLHGADGRYYRFVKNEVPTSDPHPLTIYQEVSSDGTADGKWSVVAGNIGSGQIGVAEGPTSFVDNVDPTKSWLWVDEYNNRGYVPLVSTPNNPQWTLVNNGAGGPSNKARHGSIVPLTQTEWNALRAQI